MAKVTIQATDVIATSRTDINSNFTELYDNKLETSTLDTDTALTANSDTKIATQKAIKTYVLANVNPTGASWNEYAADAGANDTYAITLTGVGAYATGQTFKFKANTANTGAATLNVNALGAKTIKKDVSSDLVTGDILANQIVTVIYDGTNMQLVSIPAGIVSNQAIPVVRTYLTAASPATWTKPAGLKYAVVEVQAGGGGGGGAIDTGWEGSGGGGGGYSKKLITVGTLGATETITIGAGGAGGSGAGAGAAGGNSSFGTHATTTGGGLGSGSSGGANGGAGGTGSSGDLNISGEAGEMAGAINNVAGYGGSSFLGKGGILNTIDSADGVAGELYGGGGSGAWSPNSGDHNGGAGAAGIVIVTEYF